jgi:acylphosphatase
VFVKRRGKEGSVRVTGKGEVEIVVSGPRERDEYAIITIQPGQTCGILGWPTYRLITAKAKQINP